VKSDNLQASGSGFARGNVLLEVIRNGQVIDTREIQNMVVDVGLAWCAGALSGDTASPNTMKYIEVGTGTTDPAAGNTTLETPVETRATGTQSRVTVTTTNDTYQAVGTITATAARALTECGMFSAAADGTMLARTEFAVINLAENDSIQVTWKITFSRA
jgi:hypothetical protein